MERIYYKDILLIKNCLVKTNILFRNNVYLSNESEMILWSNIIVDITLDKIKF